MFFYAGPTYNQAKRVSWWSLKALVPPDIIAKSSDGELKIETIFGSELHVVGLDKPQRIEGNQWCGGVIDESSDIKPGAFARSVRPALMHYEGWCWRIGVPKRFGVGAREYREVFEKGLRGEAGYESYTWPSWDILPKDEIDAMRMELDEIDFEEQAGGAWQTASGLAFYGFKHDRNVTDKIEYNPTRPLVVACDFNVAPMAWVLCQFNEDKTGLDVFDEVWLNNTNTKRTLDHLWHRYGSLQQAGWVFYGDASSNARKTSASSTDYVQIKNDERFRPRVRFPRANPAIRDRLAACNALLHNAAGEVRCHIHPRCVHLIADLEYRPVDPMGLPDDSDPNSGHITDALGYVIAREFPLRLRMYEDAESGATNTIGITNG